jgi:squalene-hopene/tetraprenyl-beta-curcumene cyclase
MPDTTRSSPEYLNLVQRARTTADRLREELISHQNSRGFWTGELSASALSTATAISALAVTVLNGSAPGRSSSDVTINQHSMDFIRRGMMYLVSQQNEDGGFGDTDRSYSNIATSYLALAANQLVQKVLPDVDGIHVDQLNRYLDSAGRMEGLRRRYGKDKTFVIPILTNLAIAGLVNWKDVSALPFEAAAVPQTLYRFVRMPVVSYAIPALVAIGQAHHHHCPSKIPPLRWLRSALINRTLKVLHRMQPTSGGYLEATPLTSFVLMSLASCGRGDHPVCDRAVAFLKASMRPDGSWPIDTNLATWVTSLAIEALTVDNPCDSSVPDQESWISEEMIQWHRDCQTKKRHPFTGAAPGGWGWTDWDGAVPDGDDTPAAMIAMDRLDDSEPNEKAHDAIRAGALWLCGLQNRDGGFPTFCRGWGRLPFDRSSVDLTAHAIRALSIRGVADDSSKDYSRVMTRAVDFLVRSQRPDGSWVPLWFGNQDRQDEDNPIYGTSRVLMASPWLPKNCVQRGMEYLVSQRNPDGGWGGGPSIGQYFDDSGVCSTVEETALAVESLAFACGVVGDETKAAEPAIIRGVENLLDSISLNRHHTAWPIGFYFAKLWYYEKLYPLIFSSRALSTFLRNADRTP